jgi:3-methyladenine DNA glycosylase/8-oxoguanine DNA glycosylase
MSQPEVQNYHPFPPPSILAASHVSASLRTLGFGYRAEFIQRTAKMLVDMHGSSSDGTCEAAEVWLRTLRLMSTDEAREELLKFVGVGRKVADCVLLMSLDKVRVWFHIVFHTSLKNLFRRKKLFPWIRMSTRLLSSIMGCVGLQEPK